MESPGVYWDDSHNLSKKSSGELYNKLLFVLYLSSRGIVGWHGRMELFLSI